MGFTNQLEPIDEKIDEYEEDRIKTEKDFSIFGKTFKPKISRVDSEGEIKSYPDFAKFTDSEIEYIQERLYP